MLQEHREAAGLSREELALRYAATRENREAMKMKDPSFWTLESEAEREVTWVKRVERSYQAASAVVYATLHALIDLLPPGTDPVSTQAAIDRDRTRQKDEDRDRRRADLRRRGRVLAMLAWNTEDRKELDLLLTQEFMDLRDTHARVAGYPGASEAYAGRSALLYLADELRAMFPERSRLEFDTEVSA
jgi:hypothetical protein